MSATQSACDDGVAGHLGSTVDHPLSSDVINRRLALKRVARVLYIGRYYPDIGAGPITRLRRKKNRYRKLRGQCGFMRSALHASFDVTEARLDWLKRHAREVAKRFDYLIVCSKSDSSGEGVNVREFDFIAGIDGLPKAFFISNPQAGFMVDDACLDCFDVVFKREHYADLNRYPIADRNRDKIRLAWLACPLIPSRRHNVARLDPRAFGYAEPSTDCRHDVCFYGTQSSRLRPEVWRRVLASDLDAIGGIQGHDIDPDVAADVAVPAVDAERYVETIRESRVNLALDGLGEFTHRHWELWLLAAFCLSSPSIRALALPGGAREYEHFVCFDDLDDMIDKIRYYATHETERQAIASAGRRLFEQTFDFKAYGRFVAEQMDQASTG
ncbi:glycosyltransferase [Salinisphaera hydrothermalis]|uniref:glycosyltransferase n=1 Tax=Salinisphaera hydrothermalis TaxID=563188 RepID=UPI003342B366